MKRSSLVLILVAFLLQIVHAEDPVFFADATLKAIVEEKLWIMDPTPGDMLELTDLRADGTGIRSLVGLEYAVNLLELQVGNNGFISDVSPLAGLTQLQWLTANQNQIKDIGPLSWLVNLAYLDIHHNLISDVSPLSGLTKLRWLSIHENRISDLSPLSGLTNVTWLTLLDNQISDLFPLSGLTNLEYLDLWDNQISDLSPLSGLTNLTWLRLRDNPLNQEACDIYIPLIRANNPGISISHDPCPTGTRIIRLTGNLAFGNVTVGTVESRLWTIHNDGNRDLTVTGISYPTGFDGWSGTVTIPGGDSGNVWSTFSPAAPQTYSGTVTVNSDKTSGTSTIACSGTGVAGPVQKPTLTLSSGPGGYVSSPGEGTFEYDHGTQVQLRAVAHSGYRFTNWSGAFWSDSNPTWLTIDSDYSLQANFERIGSDSFRFVHITDVHVGGFLPKFLKGGKSPKQKLARAVNSILEMDPRPRLVLVTGDLVDYAWLEIRLHPITGVPLSIPIRENAGTFQRYLDTIAPLADEGIQVCAVPGNHDRYVYYGPWPPIDVSDWGIYSYDLPAGLSADYVHSDPDSGYMFIGLDSGEDLAIGSPISNPDEYFKSTGLSTGQVGMLGGGTGSKIVFMHSPAVHVKDGWTIADNQAEFIKACKDNGVLLVLGGHTHENHILDSNGDPACFSDDGTFVTRPAFIQTPSLGVDSIYRVITVTYAKRATGSVFGVASVNEPTVTLEEFVSVPTANEITATLHSLGGSLHVYDSQERHVGSTPAGESERGIPGSFHFSKHVVALDDGTAIEILPEEIFILDPCDAYAYQVVGEEDGRYELAITHDAGSFHAETIPITGGEIHQYAFEWEALSRGEKGVTLQIDGDGDGQFDRTVFAGSRLTGDELAVHVSDFDGNGLVDHRDLGKLAAYWLAYDCAAGDGCEGTDLNYDGRVNTADLALFAQVWRHGLPPAQVKEDFENGFNTFNWVLDGAWEIVHLDL